MIANQQVQSSLMDLPIGVFDSGVGGLTVLSAIKKSLPHENVLYLGDTARLPYGTKSRNTVEKYALQATQELVDRKVKMLVIACNTATAAALPALQERFSSIPVIGVIDPGAQAACEITKNGHILVIATEGTIANGAYTAAIKRICPSNAVTGIACPLFVSMAEEGWTTGRQGEHALEEGLIVQAVAKRYLYDVFARASSRPDCLLLGCTHFPYLAPAIAEVVGKDVQLVDSAATTAQAVSVALAEKKLARQKGVGNWHFLTTDSPERFRRVGEYFLKTTLQKNELELVTL